MYSSWTVSTFPDYEQCCCKKMYNTLFGVLVSSSRSVKLLGCKVCVCSVYLNAKGVSKCVMVCVWYHLKQVLLNFRKVFNSYFVVYLLSHVQLFCNPMDCSQPNSFVCGVSQAGTLSGLPFPSLGDLLNPEIEPTSPALKADCLLLRRWGHPLLPCNCFGRIVGKEILIALVCSSWALVARVCSAMVWASGLPLCWAGPPQCPCGALDPRAREELPVAKLCLVVSTLGSV